MIFAPARSFSLDRLAPLLLAAHRHARVIASATIPGRVLIFAVSTIWVSTTLNLRVLASANSHSMPHRLRQVLRALAGVPVLVTGTNAPPPSILRTATPSRLRGTRAMPLSQPVHRA